MLQVLALPPRGGAESAPPLAAQLCQPPTLRTWLVTPCLHCWRVGAGSADERPISSSSHWAPVAPMQARQWAKSDPHRNGRARRGGRGRVARDRLSLCCPAAGPRCAARPPPLASLLCLPVPGSYGTPLPHIATWYLCYLASPAARVLCNEWAPPPQVGWTAARRRALSTAATSWRSCAAAFGGRRTRGEHTFGAPTTTPCRSIPGSPPAQTLPSSLPLAPPLPLPPLGHLPLEPPPAVPATGVLGCGQRNGSGCTTPAASIPARNFPRSFRA